MKQVLLLILLFPVATLVLGQQTEYAVHLNSGLFWFGGESATTTSTLILGSGRSDINYTNNPYGKKAGLGYGVAVQRQQVTAKNILYGLQAGADFLQNRVALTHAYTLISSATAPEVTGETIFRHYFINAHPFFGKRFKANQVMLDLSAGLDFGYSIKSHEKASATDKYGQTYTSSKDREKPGIDTRGRLGLTAYFHRLGLTVGYAHGLKNYRPHTEGTNLKNYARLFRFGIAYKI